MSSFVLVLALCTLTTPTPPTASRKPATAKKSTASARKPKAKAASPAPAVAKKSTATARKPKAKAASPAHTIALTQKKAPGKVITGTVRRKAPAPVKLVQTPTVPKTVTAKAPDKRKVRPESPKPRTDPYPPMAIYHLNLREYASIRVYDENGFLRPQALRQFNHINRCVGSNVVLEMDWRLLVGLYQAWLEFGMPSVTIFSGCRQAPHAKRSRHNFGMAIDYKFDGVKNRDLITWLLSHREKTPHAMGVGYYPNGYHVHMDVRDRHSFWVDLNRAGARGSMMVADAHHWFVNEKRMRTRVEASPRKEAEEQETADLTPAGQTSGPDEDPPPPEATAGTP
jgi:uncharacterized protein YcbK (DUF882 family)